MRYTFVLSRFWPKTLIAETGQNLVEFALVLTFVILPFIMVFIESSVLLYEYVSLTNAAREGARAGSIYLYVGDPGGSTTAPDAGRSADVLDAITATLGPFMAKPADCNGTAGTTTCTITYDGTSSSPLRSRETMTVALAYDHPFLFGMLGGSLTLQAQSGMRIEPSGVVN